MQRIRTAIAVLPRLWPVRTPTHRSECQLDRTLRRDKRLVFLLWILLPVVVIGSTWGEEIQHVWYSVGGPSGTSLIQPFAANNFGKFLVFGVPVYDFAIGVGARLPLNTGSFASPLVLLRHVLPNDLIPPLYLLIVSYASLTVASLTLQRLTIPSRSAHLLLCLTLSAVPVIYVTRFDWYSMAVGYWVTCVLICLVILMLDRDREAWKQRFPTIAGGAILALVCMPTSYVSYWHVYLTVGIAGLLAAGRSFPRHWFRLSASRRGLLPLLFVAVVSVGLIILDLREESRLQGNLSRNIYSAALLSPFTGLDSAKHFLRQVAAADWGGLLGILNPSSVRAFAAGNVPATLSLSTIAVSAVLVAFFRPSQMKVVLQRPELRFIAVLFLVSIALIWIPIRSDALDVSDRNIFTHAIGISTIVALALLLSRLRHVGGNGMKSKKARFSLGIVTSVLVVNAGLIVPSSLRETLSLRSERISPLSPLKLAFSSGRPSQEVDLIANSNRSERVMSLTESFDALKYFQTELSGYNTYNDLTSRNVATVNGYPKMRNQQNVAQGFRFSSSLAPSSLNVSTRDSCPVDQIRFLAVRTLVLSSQQALDCDATLSPFVAEDRFVGVRDGTVMRAVTLTTSPLYLSPPQLGSTGQCPILEASCWDSLEWERHPTATLSFRVLDPDPDRATAEIRIIGGLGDPSWVVVPVGFDPQLRFRLAGQSSDLGFREVNGFASVRIDAMAGEQTVRVSVNPDARAMGFALLPYAWLLALIYAVHAARRKITDKTNAIAVQ